LVQQQFPASFMIFVVFIYGVGLQTSLLRCGSNKHGRTCRKVFLCPPLDWQIICNRLSITAVYTSILNLYCIHTVLSGISLFKYNSTSNLFTKGVTDVCFSNIIYTSDVFTYTWTRPRITKIRTPNPTNIILLSRPITDNKNSTFVIRHNPWNTL
jgi:hypothetical protein